MRTVATWVALGTFAWGCAAGQHLLASSRAGASTSQASNLTVPPGFHISVYERNATDPRYMAFAPNGDLVVAEPSAGQVVAYAGALSTPHTVASGLSLAHGLAFLGSTLYIAHWDGVSRMTYPGGSVQTVVSGFPENRDHNLRALTAAQSTLYVSIGSGCNVCDETAPLASVLKVTTAGAQSTFATGLRNASGLAIDRNGKLWATVNQRDNIGPTQQVTDGLPPDELDLVASQDKFGWPQCYPDPQARKRDPNPEYPGADCSPYTAAQLNFQAHSAPLAIVFYYATQFPAQYRAGAFVAFHGSWNRSVPTGYKVVYVTFSGDKPTGYRDFATGWLQQSGAYTGRPAGLAVGPDGSLYISDDSRGNIYRVTYQP